LPSYPLLLSGRILGGLAKTMLSSALLLLKIDTTFIPHKFWICG